MLEMWKNLFIYLFIYGKNVAHRYSHCNECLQQNILGCFDARSHFFGEHPQFVLLVQNEIQAALRDSRCGPPIDAEELLPLCFRCGATNNLISKQERNKSMRNSHTYRVVVPQAHRHCTYDCHQHMPSFVPVQFDLNIRNFSSCTSGVSQQLIIGMHGAWQIMPAGGHWSASISIRMIQVFLYCVWRMRRYMLSSVG